MFPGTLLAIHDDVIKWKHFPRYWPFMRGSHWSPVNSRHKGQWRGALMFSFICAWINCCVNNREAGDSRRHRGHYDVTVMHCSAMNASYLVPIHTVVIAITIVTIMVLSMAVKNIIWKIKLHPTILAVSEYSQKHSSVLVHISTFIPVS